MAIEYLCSDCAELLKLSRFTAVNEIGRKYCVGCGNNDDDLLVINKRDCDKAIDSYNAQKATKKHKAKKRKKG